MSRSKKLRTIATGITSIAFIKKCKIRLEEIEVQVSTNGRVQAKVLKYRYKRLTSNERHRVST